MNATFNPQRLIFGASSGLRSVLYRSVATPLGTWLLESGALDRFAARNRERHLTGFIHHEDGVFYQYIEGEAEAVAQVWHAIQNDPRHEGVTPLHLGPIPNRRFSRWAMGFNDGAKRSLHDWAARSGLSLKGRREAQAVGAFLEYASGAAAR
ncbi:hypothetical protein GI374_00825 [Paracoccus sp. S-4012]|uniref:BLUF domain-containing protein n=1 Tax=Paracoccus sp. S-4012 TaxID=2665648 RepID=UPI0012AEF9F0|nr:BLUF domain-containing protein [Paracoccus sp. S-4012]MRX49002.1 hypothetical protein [Paracoccus sp. S-4012]